jgi:hypothetical protein
MSSYTGIPHQPGRFPAEHNFRGGLKTDYAPEATPNLSYTSAGNVHLVRQLGSEIILASDRGTERRAQLPNNYHVMGHATRDGILYLALAEVLNGTATGRGQVGSYPAPDYQYTGNELAQKGQLVPQYRPLHNYLDPAVGPRVGPLVSTSFDFSLSRPVEVQVQPSYDGSVNLLLHDRGTMPALLINSGFARVGENGYQLFERSGQVQTNRYGPADFQGRMQQQLRQQTAAKLALVSVTDGGQLPPGEMRYYLQYADADGNATAVAAEIGPVQLYNQTGNVPALSQGTLPGTNTSRRVTLQATALDKQLGYVRVSYVRRSGEPTATVTSARLSERFAVPSSGELTIIHTGLEEEEPVNLEELLPLANRVQSYVTATAADQGRLVIGGVKMTAGTEGLRTAFRKWAQSCRLGHGYAKLAEPGLAAPATMAGQPTNYYQSYNQAAKAFDGYEGGYANPLNSCYYLGYHDAEAYAWGIQAQLIDGTITDVFTFLGFDNLDGQANFNRNATYDEQGWSDDRRQNIAGVYRFPARNLAAESVGVGQNGTINVLRGQLQIPAIPLELRNQIASVRIVRAPRRPNRLLQGYLLPTLRVALVGPEGEAHYDHFWNGMRNIFQKASTENLKVLPAPELTLEASVRMTDDENDQRRGAFPFRFSRNINFEGKTVSQQDPLRYGLYAPEIWHNAATLRQQFAGANVRVQVAGVMSSRKQVKHTNGNDAGGQSFSLYQTVSGSKTTAQPLVAKLYWTNDATNAVNPGRFGSYEQLVRGKHRGDDLYEIDLAWDEYVGVELTQAPDPTNTLLNLSSSPSNSGLEIASYNVLGEVRPTALLCNVYGTEGIWDAQTLRSVYSGDSVVYAPITQWLTWQELEQQLLTGRQLPLYGGDCFLTTSMRRVTRAPDVFPDSGESVAVSQVLALVTSATVNPWARSPDGLTRYFSPLLGAETSNFNLIRDTKWRAVRESNRYNAGYSPSLRDTPPSIVSSRENAALLPYQRYNFAQRVWASAASADTALTNGWRFFPPLLFRDYDVGGGELVRILAGPSGQLLLVYERALASIQLNEKALLAGTGADAIYAQATGLLPDRAKLIASDLGCQHAFAITQSDDGAYGFDAMQGVIWQYGWGNGKAKRVSDQNVSSRLAPVAAQLAGRQVQLLEVDARMAYDPKRGDVVLSIYQNAH